MLAHLRGSKSVCRNEKRTTGINPIVLFWCEKRDLNPYGVNHTPLKRARLPVPPLSRVAYCNTNIIPQIFKMSSLFCEKVKKFFARLPPTRYGTKFLMRARKLFVARAKSAQGFARNSAQNCSKREIFVYFSGITPKYARKSRPRRNNHEFSKIAQNFLHFFAICDTIWVLAPRTLSAPHQRAFQGECITALRYGGFL